MNKMKAASESIRFMKRMNTVPEEQLRKMAREQGLPAKPGGHYEVEVEDIEEETPKEPEQGEGLEEMLGRFEWSFVL